MKILVFSDSHGFTKALWEISERIQSSVSAVIHLGDGCADMTPLEKAYPHIRFFSVRGNCDPSDGTSEQLEIELDGQRIFITHGHLFGVKSGLRNLSSQAAAISADVCLFGHTHMPLVGYSNNILMLNPGSISLPKGRYAASYGIIDISDRGVITGGVIEITAHGGRPIEFYNKR